MRLPTYDGRVPYQGHTGVQIGQVHVRSGFYFAGVAVRKRRGRGPPLIEDRPPATASCLSYANWLFDSQSTKCWPTKQDTIDLARVKGLWRSPAELQTFGLEQLQILMDQKQWSSWVSAQIEGKRASVTLNKKLYNQFFKGVSPSVTATASQSTYISPDDSHGQSTLVEASVNTSSLMGPRKHDQILQLNTSQVRLVNQMTLPLPSPQDTTVSLKLTKKQRNSNSKRRKRKSAEFMKLENMLQRKRRMLKQDIYKTMSEEVSIRIASIEDSKSRNIEKAKWLKSQTTQTQLDMYPSFIRHVNRARELEESM